MPRLLAAAVIASTPAAFMKSRRSVDIDSMGVLPVSSMCDTSVRPTVAFGVKRRCMIVWLRPSRSLMTHSGHRDAFAERDLWNIGLHAHSGLIPANLITLPHFSVSSAMNLPKSAEELANTVAPRSAIRAFIRGSARPALISLLSLSMISAGVFLGMPTPYQLLAS